MGFAVIHAIVSLCVCFHKLQVCRVVVYLNVSVKFCYVVVHCHILVTFLTREDLDVCYNNIVSACLCTLFALQSDYFFLAFCQAACCNAVAYALLCSVIYKIILRICCYSDWACGYYCLHGRCDRFVVRYCYLDLYRCCVRYIRYLRHLTAPFILITESVLHSHVFCRNLGFAYSCHFDACYSIMGCAVIHAIVSLRVCFHKLQVCRVVSNCYITVCYFANAVVSCNVISLCVLDHIAAGCRQAHVCLAFLCPLRYCVFAADLMTFHQVCRCYAFHLMARSVICELLMVSGYFNRFWLNH